MVRERMLVVCYHIARNWQKANLRDRSAGCRGKLEAVRNEKIGDITLTIQSGRKDTVVI